MQYPDLHGIVPNGEARHAHIRSILNTLEPDQRHAIRRAAAALRKRCKSHAGVSMFGEQGALELVHQIAVWLALAEREGLHPLTGNMGGKR